MQAYLLFLCIGFIFGQRNLIINSLCACPIIIKALLKKNLSNHQQHSRHCAYVPAKD
jgi:hypothetical protein